MHMLYKSVVTGFQYKKWQSNTKKKYQGKKEK
jgi:hypothetical protein